VRASFRDAKSLPCVWDHLSSFSRREARGNVTPVAQLAFLGSRRARLRLLSGMAASMPRLRLIGLR
jgi:hypothetical protein